MPESRPLILNRVCRTPVVAPATMPPTAAGDASPAAGCAPCTSSTAAIAAPERDRAVGGDVGEAEDAEADEDAEREQRQDEADRERADEQRHGHGLRVDRRERPDPAGAAHELALPGPTIGRSSLSRCSTPCSVSRLEQRRHRRLQLDAALSQRPVRERRGVEVAGRRTAPPIGRSNGERPGISVRATTPTTSARLRADRRAPA